MKKFFMLFAFALLCTGVSNAQMISASPDHSGVKFGIRGSFALSTMTISQEINAGVAGLGEFELADKPLPAGALGMALDIPVLESFHFNIGLQYVMRGQKSTATTTILNQSSKIKSFTRIGYLEVPVQPQFRLNFNNSHLNFNVGPYFALGLHGHTKTVNKSSDDEESVKTLIYSGATIVKKDGNSDWKKSESNYESPISRFDMGLAFNVAFEVEFLHIGVGYELGTRDINKDGKDNRDLIEALGQKYTPLKNRTFFATIGVNF